MECVLERLALDGGDFSLVDLQDQNGDTALNIAARIGCGNLIDQLLEVGAHPGIENRAGLRPLDFGIEGHHAGDANDGLVVEEGTERHGGVGEDFEMSVGGDGYSPSVRCPEVAKGKKRSSSVMLVGTDAGVQPASSSFSARVVFPNVNGQEEVCAVRSPGLEARVNRTRAVISEKLKGKGREIAEAVQRMVDEMSTEYSTELSAKIQALNDTQSSLRDVTRKLAQIRRTNSIIKSENEKIPALMQRIQTLESCLNLEIHSQHQNVESHQHQASSSSSTPSPSSLNSMKQSLELHQQIQQTLRQEILALKSASSQNDLKFRKIIGACAGIPTDSVDEMMDSLLAAIESDETCRVNVTQLANFMNRVKTTEEGVE